MKDGLRLIFWLPPASLVAIELYARNFDGWGAWATAPLFLIPFILGLVVAGMGVLQAISEFRSGSRYRSTLVRTCVAASPIAWLMVRRAFV